MNNFQNILAVDTSQAGHLVCRLTTPDDIYNAPTDIFFESALIPTIDDLLQKASITIEQIDAMILGQGPGSFMGLRLGFSVLRTWAWIYDINIITISSLDLLVQSYLKHSSNNDEIIIPCIDGKMKKVFTNIQDNTKHYLDDCDITPFSLVEHIKNIPNKKITVVGSGAKLIQEILNRDNTTYLPDFIMDTECFDREYLKKLDSNLFSKKSKDQLEQIVPKYLRVSAAEEALLRKKDLS